MLDEVIEGWLSKNSLLSLTSKYHKRYCILTKNELRCYKNKDDQRPSSVIELKHYSIAEKQNSKQQPHSFRLITHCRSHRTYTFIAENERDCQCWIDRINLNLKTFKGQCHHHCEVMNSLSSSSTTAVMNDDSYSVLDKWLNKLDLNDDRQSNTWIPTSSSSSSSTTTTPSFISPTPTLNLLSQQHHHHPQHQYHITSLSSSLSPKLKPFRSSTESLDSLPSETTLSSSAGSRAHSYSQHQQHQQHSHHHHQGNNNNNNSNSSINNHNRHPSPTTGYFNLLSKTNSNRTSSSSSSSSTLISKSLSSIKKHQQQSIRHNTNFNNNNNNNNNNNKIKNDKGIMIDKPTNILENNNNNNNNSNNDLDKLLINQQEEWISDDLFDFEDDSVIVEDKIINKCTSIPSCLPAPNTPLPDIPNFYMKK